MVTCVRTTLTTYTLRYYKHKRIMIRSLTIFAVFLACASAFLNVAPAARGAARSSALHMAVPCGINGFGRIGRLVARIMIKNPQTDLLCINTGASADYMAYQFKYDSVHGRWDGSLEVSASCSCREYVGTALLCMRVHVYVLLRHEKCAYEFGCGVEHGVCVDHLSSDTYA
jgi:hypothetical protein